MRYELLMKHFWHNYLMIFSVFLHFHIIFFHVFVVVEYPEETCSENYLGERAMKINERVLEHAGKNKMLNM